MPHAPLGPQVTVGVDTHKDVHVGVAVDHLGVRLDEVTVATTLAGYDQLERWARDQGPIAAFGVEGTSSYGAGLSRFLRGRGHRVIEVNRPDRSTRRRLGKSDPIDAEAAARAVLSGVATITPKTTDGTVEMIRMLKLTKDSATRARTQALNQINAVLLTAPASLRQSMAGHSRGALITCCAGLRPDRLHSTAAAAKHTLRSLARRIQHLSTEIDALRADIHQLTDHAAPTLLKTFAVGPDSAATLLCTAGDNPHRLGSEAAFAALCGTNPIPASSGKTTRHRLNRGGDRRANAALHTITVVRLRWHEPTRAYMTRRLAEGKTKTEIMRCIKRYIAREIYHILNPPTQPPTTPPTT
jgi:transposase